MIPRGRCLGLRWRRQRPPPPASWSSQTPTGSSLFRSQYLPSRAIPTACQEPSQSRFLPMHYNRAGRVDPLCSRSSCRQSLRPWRTLRSTQPCSYSSKSTRQSGWDENPDLSLSICIYLYHLAHVEKTKQILLNKLIVVTEN